MAFTIGVTPDGAVQVRIPEVTGPPEVIPGVKVTFGHELVEEELQEEIAERLAVDTFVNEMVNAPVAANAGFPEDTLASNTARKVMPIATARAVDPTPDRLAKPVQNIYIPSINEYFLVKILEATLPLKVG